MIEPLKGPEEDPLDGSDIYCVNDMWDKINELVAQVNSLTKDNDKLLDAHPRVKREE